MNCVEKMVKGSYSKRGQKRPSSRGVNKTPYGKRVRSNPRSGGFLGIENKFVDTTCSSSTLTAPTDCSGGEHDPAVGALNAIAQGDGESNRDGRKVMINAITVKGYISFPKQTLAAGIATNYKNATSVFIALVQDTQTNGAQLNSEDVFVNSAGAADRADLCFRNLQYEKRFKILATHREDLCAISKVYDASNSSYDGVRKVFTMYKKVKIPVLYNGTTQNVSTIVDNSLHIIAFCNNTDLAPAMCYNARIRFKG